MKFLSFFFLPFLLLSLSQCNSFSLDGDDKGKDDREDRSGDYDDDREQDIDYSEKRKDFLENCSEYENHIDISPLELTKGIRSCLSKAIDEGLKPLCEQEEILKEQLKRAERNGDDIAAQDIEDDLLALEEDKYALADDLYDLADSFDEVGNAARDSTADTVDEAIEGEDDEADIFGWRLFGAVMNMGITVELDGFTRLVDRRARKACRTIDFSRINTRRNF